MVWFDVGKNNRHKKDHQNKEAHNLAQQPAPSMSAPPSQSGNLSERDQFLHEVSSDLVSKQYKLYTWNDAKTDGLILTNSLLFAAVGFLFTECLKDTLAILLLALAVLLLASSLGMCLVHVKPRISSGKSGSGPNLRSLRGISSYKKWEDYQAAFMQMTPSANLKDTIRQIYGMADNNMRSEKIIKTGVKLTVWGVVMIVLAIYVSVAAARGYHALGTWQIEAKQPVSNTNTASVNMTAPTNIFATNPLIQSPTQLTQFANLTNGVNGKTNP